MTKGSRTPVRGDELSERVAPVAEAHARHAAYVATLERLEESIDLVRVGEPQIIVCIGAPGIGKTHLMHEVCARPPLPGSHLKAGIAVEAPAPSGPLASIKGTVDRLLIKLREPLDQDPTDGTGKSDEFRAIVRDLGRESAARVMAATQLIEILQPPIVCVDEAVNYALSPERAREVIARTLKWLCDQDGRVPIALFTTHAFLDLFDDLQPDLIRRFDLIEFPRYRLDVEADTIAYGSALKLFLKRQDRAGLAGKYDPWSDREWLQAKTFGCVGLLHKWFVKAGGRAARQRRHLTLDDLVETYSKIMAAPDEYRDAVVAGERRFEALRRAWASDGVSRARTTKPAEAAPEPTAAERATTPRALKPFQGSLKPIPVGSGRQRKSASA